MTNVHTSNPKYCRLLGCVILLFTAAVLSAQDWTPVACAPADLPPEAMFDVVQAIDGFEDVALNWTAVTGGQNARGQLARDTSTVHGGTGSLRVDYDFVGKPEYEYLQLGMPLEIPEPGCAFGFWLKHDGTSFQVRLRIADKSDETHQVDLFARQE